PLLRSEAQAQTRWERGVEVAVAMAALWVAHAGVNVIAVGAAAILLIGARRAIARGRRRSVAVVGTAASNLHWSGAIGHRRSWRLGLEGRGGVDRRGGEEVRE